MTVSIFSDGIHRVTSLPKLITSTTTHRPRHRGRWLLLLVVSRHVRLRQEAFDDGQLIFIEIFRVRPMIGIGVECLFWSIDPF